jgi:hypothetical protein
MSKMTIPAAVAAMLMALTGCAGGHDESRSTSTSDASRVSEPNATSVATATTEQYASVVAQNYDFVKLLRTMSTRCSWFSAGSLDSPGSSSVRRGCSR